MTRILKIITAVAVTIGAAAGLMLTSSATAQAGESKFGCPYGAVCIYDENHWPNDDPQWVYWSYGDHNLSGMYGEYMVVNNQYDAGVWLNEGYNGEHGSEYLLEGDWGFYNLTPINSITLYEYGS